MNKRVSTIALALIVLVGVAALAAHDPASPRQQSRSQAAHEAIVSSPMWPTQPLPPAKEGAAKAVFVVTNPMDALPSIPNSLRWAIEQANANTGVHDQITFAIGGGAVQTINLIAPLPWLSDPAGCDILGLTEPGSSVGPNPPQTLQLKIELNAAGIPPGSNGHGVIVCNGPNNWVEGLVVHSHEMSGITIISGPYADAFGNMILHDIVGLDPSGTVPLGNGWNCGSPPACAGICVHNTAGFNTFDNAIHHCLVGANNSEGVTIVGPIVPGDVWGNYVGHCYIGTDINGLGPMPNTGEGVCLCEGTHHNLVEQNIISWNDGDGVGLQGYPWDYIYTHDNTISNNRIGVNASGMPAGNGFHGVVCGEYIGAVWGFSPQNVIEYNTIAHNGTAAPWCDGVAITEYWPPSNDCDFNLIAQNSIFDNSQLGIDLQNDFVTMNDVNDPDDAGNRFLNFPVILSAGNSGGTTTVQGHLDIDSPENTAVVEVFRAVVDPSGHGEGATFVGSANPDALGNWTLVTTTLVVGDQVTATASDAAFNTSEFSAVMPVTGSGGCCIAPIRGDVNMDGLPGQVGIDIADLVYMVNYMFKSGPVLTCWPEGNVDGLGDPNNVDIADLVYLVNYMFKSGPTPLPCP